MATLASRVISGRGLLRLDPSSNDYKRAKIFTLYADVIRRPLSEFNNYNYNPPESRYATLRFMRNGYVVRTEVLNVSKGSWDFYLDPAAQVLYAVECAYAGILETFFNLGNALSLPSISVTNNIENWNHVDLMWDEVKVVCYADSAVQLKVSTNSYDLCPEQQDKEPDPPPPPPQDPPPPVITPGTPLSEENTPVSPPYEGEDDNGDTVPYPLDVPEEEEFPQGNRCDIYQVYARCYYSPGTAFLETTVIVYGEIEAFVFIEGNTALYVSCHGERVTSGSPCYPAITGVLMLSASSGFLPETLEYTIAPL